MREPATALSAPAPEAAISPAFRVAPTPEAAAPIPSAAAPRPEAAAPAPFPEVVRPIPALVPSAELGFPGTAGPPLPEAASRPLAGVPAAEAPPLAAPPAVERQQLPQIVPANVTGPAGVAPTPAVEPIVVPIPVYTPPRSTNPSVASGQDIISE